MMTRLRELLLATLCGTAWGVAARVWMRLVSADPEFTWSGTLFIVLVGTVAGLGTGVVLARNGRSRAVGILAFLPFAAGQGLIMLPTLGLGAVAVAQRHRRPRLAAVLAVLAVATAIGIIGPILRADLSLGRAVLGVLLYLPLMWWLSAMLAVSLAPVQHGDGAPGRRRWGERLGPQRATDGDPAVAVAPAVHEPAG